MSFFKKLKYDGDGIIDLITMVFEVGESYLIVVVVVLLLCFFFFQAEDGIRDVAVTGVQTCALPICTFICNLKCSRSSKCMYFIISRSRF